MSIRSANPKDLPAIASIHKARFPNNLLGQYSTLLIAGFYRSFLGKSLFLVHDAANGIDGFVLGGEGGRLTAAKAAFLRAHLLRCLWETLLRPHVWWQEGRRRIAALVVSKQGVEIQDPPERPTFRLLSIAVADEAVGKGVASELVRAFDRTIRHHTTRYRLCVGKDNSRAIRFYEKMGFVHVKEDGETIEFKRQLGEETDDDCRGD